MKIKVVCRKFECRKDIHYKTQTRTSCEKCNSKAFRLGIEPASSGLLDHCSTTELQKLLSTTWAQVQYIYTNGMVMPVKYMYKDIILIIFGIYTSCIFRNWSRFGSYNVYLYDTRISYTLL